MTENRNFSAKDLAYDTISDSWETFISNYDTHRREETLIGEFLGESGIQAKHCLDGGCGLGFFSHALLRMQPAHVTAIDIAPKLIEKLKATSPKIDARVGDLLDLASSLGDEQFDVVVSSEAIEHTPDPQKAVTQLCGRVRKGGVLAISVPNRRWIWLLYLAQFIGIRNRYQGYENWVYPHDLRRWVESNGFEIVRAQGVHTVPWHFLPKSVLRTVDKWLSNVNYPIALNLALLAKKTS